MMHPKRRVRFIKILLILLGIALAIALCLFGLRQNINLFYAPSQIAAYEAPLNRAIRIGGLVRPGSVKTIAKPNLLVQFVLTDNTKEVTVSYAGLLPDLFREGQGIVAEGELIDTNHFRATRVLAKHDATYMPPEVAKALKDAHLKALQEKKRLPTSHMPLTK